MSACLPHWFRKPANPGPHQPAQGDVLGPPLPKMNDGVNVHELVPACRGYIITMQRPASYTDYSSFNAFKVARWISHSPSLPRVAAVWSFPLSSRGLEKNSNENSLQ